ncbi:ATP-binding protein [Undibacterium sp. Dicai25W]|uniref:ATP-binding protein n=1 Tax=Undibacterium sp. Dicai25W TaxID=3413034 RepID=UPI003BF10B8D
MPVFRLKLWQRLALSYGTVIALLVVTSLVSLQMLSEFRATTDDALKDKYPKTILVDEVKGELEKIARAMRNTLFLTEPEQIQTQLKDIQSANERMSVTLQKLRNEITTERGRALIHQIDVVHSAYIVNQEDFVNLVGEKRMSEARNLLLVDLHPYQIQYFDALHALNLYQSELMANASSEVSQTYFLAHKVILILTCFAALLSLIITVWITRSLLRQLGGEPNYAAQIANKIASGDLHGTINIAKGDCSSLLSVMSNMRDALAERTDALESANTELGAMVATLKQTQADLVSSEKMAALGALVAGIAHELNTPIGNSVITASTLLELSDNFAHDIANSQLRRSVLDRYVEEMQQGSAILLRNLNRSSELVNSFKQLATEEENSEFCEFYLSDVVNESLLALRPAMHNVTCEIIQEIPKELRLQSYPGPLALVIGNLLNNALIHGFEHRSQGKLEIVAQTISATHLLLSISDNGVGIPAENLPRIFDPFFTTKLGMGGSGLGLHVVYNIVHSLLHGKIEVSSGHDNGTRFDITLPIRGMRNPGRKLAAVTEAAKI